MTEAHLISWIYLETNFGGHERVLSHTDEPKAEFVLADGEKALRAYEYCNLHGLWSARSQVTDTHLLCKFTIHLRTAGSCDLSRAGPAVRHWGENKM